MADRPVRDDEPIVIRTYTRAMDAEVARAILEAHDIPSAILRDDAGGMLPAMQMLWPVRLVVRSEDEEEARRVLAEG